MSFLRLEALWLLPLVLLPILIHLIHRRKHPAVPWAAMMFVTRAARSRRGGAKVRRWLVLAIRTLLVAAVLMALARPLSSGRFGLAAGRVASTTTVVILLDRSPSMQRRLASGETRQALMLRQVRETLNTLGARRVVLIDSVSLRPQELSGAKALGQSVLARGASSRAGLPGMLRVALDYLGEQEQNVADVWICSDRQLGDWQADSPSWDQIDQDASRLGKGLRFHTFRLEPPPPSNSSVFVTEMRWVTTGDAREASLAIEVVTEDASKSTMTVQVSVGSVTTSVDVPLQDGRGEVADYRVPLMPGRTRAEGWVSIPPDVNAADDHWYFSMDAQSARPIGLVLQSKSPGLEAVTEVLGAPRVLGPLNSDRREDSSLSGSDRDVFAELTSVVWQGPLPRGTDAELLTGFLERGGSVIFFPPRELGEATEFAGVRWTGWETGRVMQARFDDWEFQTDSYCRLEGELVRRAIVEGDSVFAGSRRIGDGTVWFCGGNVIGRDQPLVNDGVALYGMLSAAIDASRLDANDGGLIAGADAQRDIRREVESVADIQWLRAGSLPDSPFEVGHQAGILSIATSDQAIEKSIVVNRSPGEFDASTLAAEQVAKLVPSVRWNVIPIDDRAVESRDGFVSEVWGIIWALLIAGMFVEAWLTLPSAARGKA